MSLEEVDLWYVTIWSWWYLSEVANEGTVHELNNWFNFWHFHVQQWGGFILDVQFLFSIYLSLILTSFILYVYRNSLWRRKLTCWLLIYPKQSITFGSNNLVRGVPVSLLQRPTIMCNHLGSHYCIMFYYKVEHLGLVWKKKNYNRRRPINMGSQFKFLSYSCQIHLKFWYFR
jgi:hypothetical protein